MAAAKSEQRIQAQSLRREGRSILKIAKDLGVAKSSVSMWCRGIEISSDQRSKLIEGQKKAIAVKLRERLGEDFKTKICEDCGQRFSRHPEIDGKVHNLSYRKVCLDCQPFRKGGTGIPMRNGEYLLIVAPPDYPGMRYRDKYCYEHTYMYWKNSGTLPGPDDVIHHKNENPHDNRFDNLELKTRPKHSKLHGELRGKVWALLKCPACGEQYVRTKRNFFYKKVRVSHCSKSCGNKKDKPYLSENIVGMFRFVGTATVAEAESVLKL